MEALLAVLEHLGERRRSDVELLELGEEPGQPRIVLLVDVTRRIIEVTLPEHAERINDAVLRCLDGINQPAAVAASPRNSPQPRSPCSGAARRR